MAKSKKLILLDGNSLANRAFYALRLFSASDGTYTNAVYGFLTMLYRLLEEEKPDYLAVAFDKGGATFRHEQFAEYKGTRKGAPDEFRPQLELLRDVLSTLNVPWFRMERFEADDLLGTLSKQAAEQGVDTVIVTGDKDALQLVDDHVTTMLTKKGISDTVRYTPQYLKEEMGLTPSQIIDLKALMGDASDNIPGVPGVGEKTALKLLADFGTLEGVYENLDQVKGALKQKLADNKESAFLSKQLATIVCDAPVSFDAEEFALKEPNWADAIALFKRLEFKSLLPKVTPPEGNPEAEAVAEAVAADAVREVKATVIEGRDQFEERLAALTGQELVAVLATYEYPKDDPGRPLPKSVAVQAGADVLWAYGDTAQGIGALLESHAGVIGFDLKPLYNWAYGEGLSPKPPLFDGVLAAYLLDPGRTTFKLEDLARQYGFGEVPDHDLPDALATRCSLVPALRERLMGALAENGLTHIFKDIEQPLLAILAEMEAVGVGIQPATLREMSTELEQRIDQLTAEIHELAGEKFNIGSPKQLGEILFDKLKLPAGKKTKTGGYSTDAEVLEELADQHEVVAKILDYRTLTKLKSTYVDALGSLVAKDGRIHTTFHQTVAETGRLSSKDPNLQNIPVRIEEGRRIRRAFVPKPGNVLVAADYSQVELRVVAHYSGDQALREAFERDQDIHARTAAEVMGVSIGEVTSDMRRQAKAVNFGLIYGQTDFGLARATGMTRAEAKRFIERYFEVFAGVKQYMDDKKAEARENGFVTTLDGRKRLLPEITHRIFTIRQNAERMAINTPIQGTAADMMKKAMIAARAALAKTDLKANMILQVHDELVFEAPEAEVEKLSTLLKREMEGAMKLDVPLKADVKVGCDWYSVEKV